jgi:hypothetical protein
MRASSSVGFVLVFVGALTTAAPAQSARAGLFAGSPQYPLLPRALEIELALSAAPAHLRGAAEVWTLEQNGYVLAKQGTNAFTCVVSRRAGDLFPVCWDAEGARSLLKLDFEDAVLRLAGKSTGDIDRIVHDGFASGRYHAPARAGVAYMLSPMRYRIDERGAVTRTVSNPHLMFYGPDLRDGDIGGARGAFVFMNRVGPDGMMIVPVGEKERQAIVTDSQPLVAQVEQALGYQATPADTPAAATTTAVLVNLTIKPDVERSQLLRVMPDEVRATVKLYLDGRIQQWFARSDGRGVVFILNSTSLEDAKEVMAWLPLSKANFANLEFVPLGPLTPLRLLLAQ